MNIFEIKNLTLEYEKNKPILKNVSLDIKEGDFVSIIGPNGCGKSTLIKSLSKILLYKIPLKDKICNYILKTNFKKIFPKKTIDNLQKKSTSYEPINQSGDIFFKGKKLYSYNSKEYAKMVSYVPQIIDFPNDITVYDFVKIGRFPYSNFLEINSKKNEEIILNSIELVGLSEYKNHYINDLSGGQRQRALIALSLAQDTQTIILDEPTNHLDIRYQLEIIHLLHDLNHKLKKTIILVIHDINHAMKFSDKILVMKDGEIKYFDETNIIVNEKMIKDIFSVNATITYSQNKKIISDYWIDDLKNLDEYS